jgi:hypothetical protein
MQGRLDINTLSDWGGIKLKVNKYDGLQKLRESAQIS